MRAGRLISVAGAVALAASLAACAPEGTARSGSGFAALETAVSDATTALEKQLAAASAALAGAPVAAPAEATFDRTAHSIDDPMSIWVVGNKQRPLNPPDFEPSDLVYPEGVENTNGQPLREVAARAVERLIAAASADGLGVRIISAYRPYSMQVDLYNGYVARDGQAAADTYSARPGHSEHQTGLTVDFDDGGACMLEGCFGDTPAGQWIAEHAGEFGFIERYPGGKEHVTGFMPEPWHYRYVGTELAAQMKRTGVTTLEEFFDLPAAPGYAG